MSAATKPAPASDAAPAAVPDMSFWTVIGRAIAQRIAAPPRVRAQASTSLLDFILVIGALLLVGGGLYGLFMVPNISDKTLPIIASLLSFISGSILGAYAGYRWGASDAMKRQAVTTTPATR